jgi:alpha-tubulin suppressor-like RCC1 family protein
MNDSYEFSQFLNVPTKIQSLADKIIVSASCGRFNSCALTQEGALFIWGKRAHETKELSLMSDLIPTPLEIFDTGHQR